MPILLQSSHGGNSKAITEGILAEFRAQNKLHYVYILNRPNGEPFYVGKGQNKRVFEHEVEARGTLKTSHKLNIIRSSHKRGEAIRYSIHAAFESHDDALAEEETLIQKIGRFDQGNGPLTNQTDGGEGGLNPSEESKERHRQTLAGDGGDDPDRAAANIFFAEFSEVKSTPIKPTSSYERSVSTLHKNRDSIGMKPRNSGALVAMAVAQEVVIQPGAELSRRFSVEGTDMILENGCGRDMIVNGMIDLVDDTPKHETIRITASGVDYILKTYDRRKLISYGVLEE